MIKFGNGVVRKPSSGPKAPPHEGPARTVRFAAHTWAGKKREARQCIQKKKMYEQQLTTLGTSKMNLENQKLTMESLNTTTKINVALRNGKKAITDSRSEHT